jgi:NAD(P)-dependent dehydrogenase (short-subunit alcohol dehydrogenase family)
MAAGKEVLKHRALVTGGSRGIGRAIVDELRRRGMDVLAPGREELDLAKPASVQKFIKAEARTGIDVLVNNAGINHIRPLVKLDAAAWQEMIQVNLTAPMELIQGFSGGMRERKWGRIVNISSVFSLVTREGRAAYSSTKSGLNGLTRTCAVELAPEGILVNAVCPGYVETEMTRRNNGPAELAAIASAIPLRRLAQPDEIARVVGFLCSEENTYCTGQLLAVDGGFTVV